MKKFGLFIICAAALLSLSSCGSSRRLTSITADQEEVKLIFTESKYKTDKKYFRDNQSGVSNDISNAKKLAIQNTRQALASYVCAEVKLLVQNYVNVQAMDGEAVFDSNDMEELGSAIVNIQLSGIELVEERAFKLPDGSYRYHVCMQFPKDDLYEAVNKTLVGNAKLQQKLAKKEFMDYFNDKLADAE